MRLHQAKRGVAQRNRALIAWPILVDRAKSEELITYGDLGDLMGIHARTCTPFLNLIAEACRDRGYPKLHSIVVSKRTGVPGHGYCGSAVEDIRATHDKVFRFRWDRVVNPFE